MHINMMLIVNINYLYQLWHVDLYQHSEYCMYNKLFTFISSDSGFLLKSETGLNYPLSIVDYLIKE